MAFLGPVDSDHDHQHRQPGPGRAVVLVRLGMPPTAFGRSLRLLLVVDAVSYPSAQAEKENRSRGYSCEYSCLIYFEISWCPDERSLCRTQQLI